MEKKKNVNSEDVSSEEEKKMNLKKIVYIISAVTKRKKQVVKKVRMKGTLVTEEHPLNHMMCHQIKLSLANKLVR